MTNTTQKLTELSPESPEAKALREFNARQKTIFLDTETTGLNHEKDDVLEISIINGNGEILLNTLVTPTKKTEWPEAEEIHGISPKMIAEANAPTLERLVPEIDDILTSADNLVIYNSKYDLPFIEAAYHNAAFELPRPNIYCAMLEFAEVYGQWDDRRGQWKWQKLTAAANHVKHEWEGKAHRALADCQATRSVWNWLTLQERATPQVSVKSIITDIMEELAQARRKFPSNEDVLPALTEEVGELNRAMLQQKHEPAKGRTHRDIYNEAKQTAVMAIRVMTEGDPNFPYHPATGHAKG